MNSFIKSFNMMMFTLIFVILISAAVWCKEEVYESKENICKKCQCAKLNTSEFIVDDLDPTNLTAYYKLDCSKKEMKHLLAGWPEDLGKDEKTIEIIYAMSYNVLKSLQQFPATDAMLFFICEHCQIEQIEPEIFIDTPNLSKLDLSWNKIKSDELRADIFRGRYSDEVYESLKLKTLKLSHNQINRLEKDFFEHVPEIRILRMSHNPIKEIDEPTTLALGSLHNLEILDLSYTEILDLPDIMFQNLKHLNELFLDGNKFLKVPESLALIGKSLQYLYLNNNPITVFNDESFLGLEHLSQLNISGMDFLTEIKDGSIKNLPALEVLLCYGNKKFNQFAMKDLRGLEHLKQLDLSKNALKTLDFGDNLVIKDVELVIKNVSAKMVAELDRQKHQFEKLTSLKLEGNPFHCDCVLLNGLSKFDVNSTYYQENRLKDSARCKSPYDLSGKSIYVLLDEYECNSEQRKIPRIPIYEPPHFLRPKSIMLTVVSVVACVVLGIFVGFVIVIIKRRIKKNANANSSPVRYTTVRDSAAYS